MDFDTRMKRGNRSIISRFKNVTASVTLAGAVVKEIPGIFDEAAEVVSPFDSDRPLIKPVLVVESIDFAGVTSEHVIRIGGVDYKFDGKPQASAGLTTIYLGVKK